MLMDLQRSDPETTLMCYGWRRPELVVLLSKNKIQRDLLEIRIPYILSET